MQKYTSIRRPWLAGQAYFWRLFGIINELEHAKQAIWVECNDILNQADKDKLVRALRTM
jgi:hypothetical protein